MLQLANAEVLLMFPTLRSCPSSKRGGVQVALTSPLLQQATTAYTGATTTTTHDHQPHQTAALSSPRIIYTSLSHHQQKSFLAVEGDETKLYVFLGRTKQLLETGGERGGE